MKNLGGDRWSLNDDDREDFVKNDEFLYLRWLHSRVGISTFVRARRAELDKHIKAYLNQKPTS